MARQISHAAAMKKQFLKAVKSAIAMRPQSQGDDGNDMDDEGFDSEEDGADDDGDGITDEDKFPAAAAASVVPGTPMDGPSDDATPLEKLRYFTWLDRWLRAQYRALMLRMYFPRDEAWKMRVFIPD